MKLPRTLNARLLMLLLIFGLALIAVSFVRNVSWIRERRIVRLGDDISDMGVRLSGMMQHLVRRKLVAPAELEMSYAATTQHLELGVVCDEKDRVLFSTRLQWVNVPLSDTSLNDASALAREVKKSMTPQIVFDPDRLVITGCFPFFEHYHSRDRGVVLLRFDMREPMQQASRDAMLESLAQGAALLALCALLWLILDLMVTKRVQQLADYAADVGAGEQMNAAGQEDDELSAVARSFEAAVQKLRATELRLLEAAEAERRKIGADIHDDVCQRMVAAQLKSGVLESLLAREGHPQAELAGAVAEELAKATRAARGFARGLAPVLVQKGRLEDALVGLAAAISESFAIRCECSCRLDGKAFGLWVETHVYRIAQELATNAAKHAHPSFTTITAEILNDRLILRVENDGGGIESRGGSGIGLELVAQRVRALGGRWSIAPRAEAQGGSLALCEVPLDARHFQDAEAPQSRDSP